MFHSIPIQILEYAQINRFVPVLKMYLILKLRSSGIIKKKELSKALHPFYKDRGTKMNHFNQLIDLNWISFNKKSKLIHIHSFARILEKNEDYKNRRVFFKEEYFECFREFVFVSLIGSKQLDIRAGIKYGVNKHGEKMLDFAGYQKWNPFSQYLDFSPKYIGLSTHTIAEITNLSTSQVSRLKQKCNAIGLATIKHMESKINLDNKSIQSILEVYPPLKRKVHLRRNKYVYQYPDFIIVNLIYNTISPSHFFKKRKKQLFSKMLKKGDQI